MVRNPLMRLTLHLYCRTDFDSKNMSDSSEKTISEYEKDAFEEEPIEEYVEEEGLLIASDNMSEVCKMHPIALSVVINIGCSNIIS